MVHLNGMNLQLVWGCDPRRQFESNWLFDLISPMFCHQINAFDNNAFSLQSSVPSVLVESGLLFLERSISGDRIVTMRHHRSQRIQRLLENGPFLLMHISDEEGLDVINFIQCCLMEPVFGVTFPTHVSIELIVGFVPFPLGPEENF